MKKLFVAGIVAATCCGVPAIAADMPTKAPVRQGIDPIFSWSGFYVGLNAGGNWGRAEASTTIGHIGDYFGTCGVPICTDPFLAANRSRSFNTNGFTGGYNWQAGNIVGGVEFDFQYFRSAGSLSVIAPFAGNDPLNTRTVNSSISTDWLVTARPRLGVAANNWLFYGTGGLAVTRLKANWGYSDSVTVASENAAASATKTGWVVGGGVEVALPGSWLIGGEYLYVRFNGGVSGTGNIVRPGTPSDDVLNHTAGDLRSNIVRLRLNYKFGDAVVAKY